MAIQYLPPPRWLQFQSDVYPALAEARASVYALTTTPFQRSWVERLQEVQLKMEVAGTSKIEGAEFTERELEAALRADATAETLFSRSQRQARAAKETYEWLAKLPTDFPFSEELVFDIHRRIVTGCDDDHCEPGRLRGPDYNVTFGVPIHRGCEGGRVCEETFRAFCEAVETEFRDSDPLIQALAAHYHLAAMHPFQDGNGRTARAIEAFLLRRAGLRDSAFIAMSNYYYDNKTQYLNALAEVRGRENDLTPFLRFGLEGIATQCKRLFSEIRREMQKALFENTMYQLFNRLQSPRKRVMKERQIQMLRALLKEDSLDWAEFSVRIRPIYQSLKSPVKALTRDIANLVRLRAIEFTKKDEAGNQWAVRARLDWPAEITESEFFKLTQDLPEGRSHAFLKPAW